jgi:enediyne biosynthesis protein E4
MPEAQPHAPVSSSSPERTAVPAAGMSPLLRVIGPLIVAAFVTGALLTRYSSVIAPPRPAPTVRFTDVTAESGLSFVHQNGATADQLPPTTLGSGVAVLDFDRDGFPDLFFVNGDAWPWADETAGKATCQLYRNDGHGRFVDVTDSARAGLKLQGMGAYPADFDNDGWTDLLVTGVGENHLLHNRGDGTFDDVTEAAGLSGDAQTWSTGALWWDLDGDGRLDLIVCQYARWSREVDLELAFKIAGVGRSYGAASGFVGASPSVYRNVGDGRFAPFPESIGLRNLAPDSQLPRPEVLAVAPVDSNGDGLMDLVFYYHASEPTLFLNQGGGVFREWTGQGERREGETAGLMSLGALPLTRNGDSAAILSVQRALDGAIARAPGILRLTSRLGFALIDYDLDGRVDAFSGGGRAEGGLNRFDAGRDFDASPGLWWNQGNRWVAAPALPDARWTDPLRSRGIVSLDYDGDGDEDIVITQNGGHAKLLRNDQRASQAWLRIQLVGTKSPRDGTGAKVEVQTPRHKLSRIVAPPVGYLSECEQVLTLGLGEDERVRGITVTWPSGTRQQITAPAINQKMVVVEPN